MYLPIPHGHFCSNYHPFYEHLLINFNFWNHQLKANFLLGIHVQGCAQIQWKGNFAIRIEIFVTIKLVVNIKVDITINSDVTISNRDVTIILFTYIKLGASIKRKCVPINKVLPYNYRCYH
jgi:hypothetical protein